MDDLIAIIPARLLNEETCGVEVVLKLDRFKFPQLKGLADLAATHFTQASATRGLGNKETVLHFSLP